MCVKKVKSQLLKSGTDQLISILSMFSYYVETGKVASMQKYHALI